MNTDLIARALKWLTDNDVGNFWSPVECISRASEIIKDCKAEIEILSASNESLRNQNTALDAECARLEAELAKAKDYVPMTDAELNAISGLARGEDPKVMAAGSRDIEQAVLARIGVAPTLDQARKICEANGLAVVPVEPTKAMLKYVCNCECFINLDSSQAILDDYYKAMLAAAKDSP